MIGRYVLFLRHLILSAWVVAVPVRFTLVALHEHHVGMRVLLRTSPRTAAADRTIHCFEPAEVGLKQVCPYALPGLPTYETACHEEKRLMGWKHTANATKYHVYPVRHLKADLCDTGSYSYWRHPGGSATAVLQSHHYTS